MNSNITVKGPSYAPAIFNAENLLAVPSNIPMEELRSNPDRYPRLKSIAPGESIKAMTILVSTAFTIRGQRPDAGTLNATASILYDTMMSDDEGIGLASISFPEIARIIKRSALNDDVPVSVASLYAALKKYAITEGHKIEENVRQARKKADFGDFLASHPQYSRTIGDMFKSFGK